MFHSLLEAAQKSLAVTIDGHAVACREGDSVAAALLTQGVTACRTTAVSGAWRAPFCMMGVCYDCLVMIDGTPNLQACMTPVCAGMRIERQLGPRKVTA